MSALDVLTDWPLQATSYSSKQVIYAKNRTTLFHEQNHYELRLPKDAVNRETSKLESIAKKWFNFTI